MTPEPHPSKEDVLDELAIEPDLGRQTLERYLSDYPHYAEEIVDLAAELAMPNVDDLGGLSPDEEALIDSAWKKFANSTVKTVLNPFASFSATDLKSIAVTLGIKRSVLTAFRECAVIAASVPGRFMQSLANALRTEKEVLLEYISRPPADLAREYKSETKPQAATQVSFEQLLIDAEMSEPERKSLLMED